MIRTLFIVHFTKSLIYHLIGISTGEVVHNYETLVSLRTL